MADEYIRKADAIKQCGFGMTSLHIADNLRKMRPADVVQVVHGRWVKYTGMGKEQWMCSECSAEEKNPKVANYCYHCGAKMDAKEKG